MNKISQWIKAKKRRWISLILFLVLFVFYLFCLPARLFDKPTSTILLDFNDQLLSAQIAKDGQWRFPHNNSVPKKFKICIIEFEDRNFNSHFGVHPPSIGRAIVQNVKAGEIVSGGSTITMQVIRMSRNNPSRSFSEKFTEMIRALRLESKYTKEEILSYYSSNAPMGGNVVGIDAAAWRYFNRSAHDLTWAESATLAVLPNAPSLIYPGKNQQKLLEKRNRLLDHLQAEGYFDESTLNLAKLEPLPQKTHRLPQDASHLLNELNQRFGEGIRHQTSIQKQLQNQVKTIVERHSNSLSQSHIYNAAVLILDVKNNQVISYIGNTSSPDKSKGDDVDVIQAPRSTGSILKPFLYANMLNDGELLPKMLVPDVPAHFQGYTPKNFTHNYEGSVPANRALSKSLNVPAVYMLSEYGVPKFHDKLKKMKFDHLFRPSSDYGLSLVLGGAEASLWEISHAYASMSRDLQGYFDFNGKYSTDAYDAPSFYAAKKTDEKNYQDHTVVDAAAIYQTFNALMEVNRPTNEIGWENFSSSHKLAWKTGTSFGFRDAWAVGTSPDYVVGVWVGNADGEGRPGIVGVHAAAPILFDVFDLLPTGSWFQPPYDDMVEVPICSESGHRAGAHCANPEKQWIPLTGNKTSSCPYHQIIHVNTAGQRVFRNCADGDLNTKKWFVLPRLEEWYYAKKHPEYITLPDWSEACKNDAESNPLDLIYPKNNMDLYIPIDMDGKQTKIVCKASHRSSEKKIYWHINEDYLGVTSEIHHMEVQHPPGDYIMTLVDEDGFSIQKKFRILEKGNS